MRILIVKTSSLGDVIHTLPAVTDAGNSLNSIIFDWVVEEDFQEVPHWHKAVDNVYPVALRRWRKCVLAKNTRTEWKAFRNRLNECACYDYIIDAQGLIKSAFLSTLARGPRYGYDKKSAREPMASFFYNHHITVQVKKHAVQRVRELFSQALGYTLPLTPPNYGLSSLPQYPSITTHPYLVFLHGTSTAKKQWPMENWRKLIEKVNELGYRVYMPWGNQQEKDNAEKIAMGDVDVHVLPKLNLNSIAGIIKNARMIVSVDTGLAHLAAALDKPVCVIYGPSSPQLCGTCSAAPQYHLHRGGETSSVDVNTVFLALNLPKQN